MVIAKTEGTRTTDGIETTSPAATGTMVTIETVIETATITLQEIVMTMDVVLEIVIPTAMATKIQDGGETMVGETKGLLSGENGRRENGDGIDLKTATERDLPAVTIGMRELVVAQGAIGG